MRVNYAVKHGDFDVHKLYSIRNQIIGSELDQIICEI